MAKKDQQSTRLPKRIAGVKVPKELRKSGAKLVDALSHPLIADVAAAALMAAAGALRESENVRKVAGKAKDRTGDATQAFGQAALNLGAVLADTAIEGVRLLSASKPQAAPTPRAKKAKSRAKKK